MAKNRQLLKQNVQEESYADLWDLYHSLAAHIATQLRRFLEAEKRRYHTVPSDFRSEKDWQGALRTMICTFDLLASPSNLPEYRDSRLSEVEQEKLIHEGLKLFCDHFQSLWL
jgi:hypothetical protein